MIKISMRSVVGLAVLCLLAVRASGADWPQWHGANRDCVVPGGPSLADAWPEKGPVCLWQSERIPGNSAGGYGSVVVSDGKVYVFCTPKVQVPIIERKLGATWKSQLGYVDPAKRPPVELDKKVEAACLSAERATLKGPALTAWMDKFLADNLVSETDKKAYSGVVKDRLNRGAKAMAWADLDKVAGLNDKTFPGKAELDVWLKEAGFKADVLKMITSAFPGENSVSKDVLWCVDARDGKTLWSKDYAGEARAWGSACTPAVADGKVFAIGSDSMVYCLNAKTGEEIWKHKASTGERSSSFLVMDGVAYVLAGPLTAYEAATGKVLWQQDKVSGRHQSPMAWKHEGKSYLICNTDKKLVLLDPKDGSFVWEIPCQGWGTPALQGDRMVVLSSAKKMSCYALGLNKPADLWSVPVGGDRGASPVLWKDHVYALYNDRSICVNLESGKVCWEGEVAVCECGSTVAVDGKLLGVGRKGEVFMVQATPEKMVVLAKSKLGAAECTTPAIVDGRMYVRLGNGIGCFDLTGVGGK